MTKLSICCDFEGADFDDLPDEPAGLRLGPQNLSLNIGESGAYVSPGSFDVAEPADVLAPTLNVPGYGDVVGFLWLDFDPTVMLTKD